ncbi:MAG: acetyl-CoA carboxylase biotin carboxyl carrier protein [Bacteroidota bacterium]
MNLAYIKKLMKLVADSGVDELEIEEEGKKIRISKSRHNSTPYTVGAAPPTQYFVPAQNASGPTPAGPIPAPAEAAPEAAKELEKPFHEIRSPIVGTFYRAPAPDAEPYVEVGSMVQPGTVLCIVEAMKLMNEIESDAAGQVVKIFVENAQPVEYNQVLFHVEPS